MANMGQIVAMHSQLRVMHPISERAGKWCNVVAEPLTYLVLPCLLCYPCYPDLRIHAGHEDARPANQGKTATQKFEEKTFALLKHLSASLHFVRKGFCCIWSTKIFCWTLSGTQFYCIFFGPRFCWIISWPDAIAYKSPNSKWRGDGEAPSELWGVREESAIKHFSATIDGPTLNPPATAC